MKADSILKLNSDRYKSTKAPIPCELLPLIIAHAAFAAFAAFACIYIFFWANPSCCDCREHSTKIAAAQAAQQQHNDGAMHSSTYVIGSNVERNITVLRLVIYHGIAR